MALKFILDCMSIAKAKWLEISTKSDKIVV